ncbi:ABC transporter permease [Gardnerella vaginalis]|uniref:Efflux ABC transporter, permease protein n=2 Tax=Gardnerella vaginalis TaxID=2702 RepID=E3D713_GARV3|nr:ABC transporter permease [Gardnerella vaginalis]ADP38123.1 efflux ABC transporter, permease protein [Gardnerella vaginalis ATCC 14019]KOS09358.1 multidrug DMT transporter permease [Gardnerella vaginalis]TCH80718.1 ABC transporter permease [Gardnerella vaginalis]TCH82723.1 ABC transporter permease [Gardnerella vaginalis ATCC 14018 = JCM 11026]SDR83062.1 putative ABC transport system permease protein [Gardnerella vaginalis]
MSSETVKSKKIKRKYAISNKRSRSIFPMVFISAIRMWFHEWRRFCILAVIAMLGVAVMTGIYAGCNDMLLGANDTYSKLKAYDLQIISTLGLTDKDVKAIKKLPFVSEAEAEKSFKATAHPSNNANLSYAMNVVQYNHNVKKLNRLHLMRGNMPTNNRQAVVTERFLHDSGLRIGSTLFLSMQQVTNQPNSSNQPIQNQKYKLLITGSVLDVNDLDNPNGYQSKAFRNSVISRYPIFTSAITESTNNLPYTAIYVRLNEARRVNDFSQKYRAIVANASNQIKDSVQSDCQEARTNQVVKDQTNQQVDQTIANMPMLKNAPDSVLAKARAQIYAKIKTEVQKHVPQARWHIFARISNGSYTRLRSDVASIQSLGYAFPVLFLVVAMMMSLTAMARMVEEERGLIGTYLSLGYGRCAAITRHAFFAIFACLVGGGIGDILGFLAIPSLLLKILRGLYTVPGVVLRYDWLYGSICVLAFVIPVAICTIIVSWRETRQVPAALLRPKSPKAGARVLLEHLPFIWNRLSFLNKVSIRNLARFKGRLFMTIGGVAGCTALIVCALALNDTVATLGIRQYDGIYRYDMISISTPDAFQNMKKSVQKDKSSNLVDTILPAYISSGEIAKSDADNGKSNSNSNNNSHNKIVGDSESVQIVVVKDAAALSNMVRLQDVNNNLQNISLNDDGPLLSQSAASSLGIASGNYITITNSSFKRAKVKLRAVVRNLIGSNIYMTSRCYERIFGFKNGKNVKNNALIMRLRGDDDARMRYADHVADRDGVLAVMNITRMKHSFSFDLMNAVVALIVTLAAGLALAVLFTLSSTNISERAREMATLKVLGFYRREVHAYVHKEMLTLTVIGILVGLPLGRLVAGLLTNALRMPSLYFEVEVSPLSYVIAGFATLIFALIVQWSTNPALDRIDPVSSLKSVE